MNQPQPWIAIFGFLVALVTTFGAIALKRRYDMADRREAKRQKEEDECDRYKIAFGVAVEYGRRQKQSINALAVMLENNPKYVSGRLIEMAAEQAPFDELRNYVDTGENKPKTD